ncbi:hypothetical protein [Pseudoalteromonas sp. L21]|uniref:hypothetical protein n=1 Tax=Pseudoalteromonas sp. L21 TaxID=1539746 RepID=UPI001F22EF66|nr:hypothetical protein [Pseudoalteromonas sp. L21]MCF7519833.1 hypothetical protein [Pseudoalteromonas sp. L21]
MNKKERQAVLKMLLIREDLTDKEFFNAIDFIRGELIEGNSLETILQKDFSVKKKSRETTPELLNELKNKQPEKYKLLTELYKYVQDATVFKSVSGARQFGRIIGLKDTDAQPKQKVISNIFKVLSEMNNELIVEQMEKVEQFTEKSDESYQKLSKFLMNSKQS